ncbi:SNF2 family N-terminal domain-containing protein [Amylocystis lapponica]|nr:SNF2 family N-terminal domain-containing protein [Amylocystis lapponica]
MARPDDASGSGGRRKSAKKRIGGTSGGADERRVEDERAVWIAERQTELDSVLSRHDTLVREAFQMEKFVSLLAYDPKVAKEDNSAVFQEYHSRYDLLQQSAAAAGPSRRTRRAQTERLQALKGSVVSLPSTSPRKANATDVSDNAIWNIIASGKSKGKKVGVDVPGLLPKQTGKGKAKAIDDEAEIDVSSSDPIQSPTRPRYVKRVGDSVSANGTLPVAKKRRLEPSMSSYSAADPQASSISVSGHKSHRGRRPATSALGPPSTPIPKRTRQSVAAELAASSTQSVYVHAGPSSPAKTPLPRIKLIVRRPDPAFSNPRQKPPPPRHGESLDAFLSSYKVLGDKDVDLETLEQMARKSAAFWDRVDSMRRQGRLLPADGSRGAISGVDIVSPHDAWANVVNAVEEHARAHARVRVDGRQVAAQVASKVRAYWEGQAVREDKVKMQKDKRLRALAKMTIRLVTAEWKRAVHHVREQERLRLEAEERRRGHEHLDAILDQSGQILEAQQLDLARAAPRSRSSSVSATLRHWASQSPEPDESASDTERNSDDDDPQDQPESSTDDEEQLGSNVLLGLIDHPSYVTRTSSRSVSQSPPPTEDVPESDLDSESAVSQDLLGIGHIDPFPFTDAEIANDDERSPSTPISPLMKPTTPPALNDITMHSNGIDQGPPHDIVQATAKIVSPRFHPVALALDTALREREARSSTPTTTIFPSTISSIRDSSDTDVDEDSLPDHDAALEIQSPPVTPSTYGTEISEPESEPSRSPSSGRAASTPDDISSLTVHCDLRSTTVPASTAPQRHPSDETPEKSGSADGKLPPEHVLINNTNEQATALESIAEAGVEEHVSIPPYLWPYAVAPVEWDPQSPIKPPLLLRGTLRPYQQAGLEWLASIHMNNLNGILADEMGLGKTIQTISLLAHLACDRGIWGPHLIIVPTSVLLNWEMEFKKFLPGFKVLSYHGNTKRRKELRQGWNDKYHFNVCVTSYTLASRDAHVFKRKPWYYMILDEAHMIKNFKSQRWNLLLMFRSFRRLLLTGTPLQNNLTELWALLQFLMSGTNFANLKEFADWFSNPLEKAIEMGNIDDETQQRVAKLHMVLRPYLLRRLKRDVEKELPSKFEHLVMCPLSKRQRFLYDEFMARADTRHDLQSGVYQKIANILMQLRKVVNHPDLFEVRPIRTSFAMGRSAITDFEIKELLVRRHLLQQCDQDQLNLGLLGLQFVNQESSSLLTALETRRLDATSYLPKIMDLPGEPPPNDTRTIDGYKRFRAFQKWAASMIRWSQIAYLNRLRCAHKPLYSSELISVAQHFYQPLVSSPPSASQYLNTMDSIRSSIKSYSDRAEDMADIVERFAFVTPAVVARDLPVIALSGSEEPVLDTWRDPSFDAVLHRPSVKLQIAFPDPSLLQYDCGKLQELTRLLRERKAGGHRILIFTQMTKILDILEIFLNFHGYLYLRLDGATKIEDRQYITERFNTDSRIFCFIASSRSGGVGINLTGADTVVFYDSDFNPQMDRQCEDRAHRIGQIRDVHIYRFVSQHTVEEALLRKANQKRSLDDLVIQKGEFDWRSLFSDETALTKAMGDAEDTEDAHAAAVAASEEVAMEGADEADFELDGGGENAVGDVSTEARGLTRQDTEPDVLGQQDTAVDDEEPPPAEEDEGGTTVDYMLTFVRSDMEFFGDWRI